MPSSAHIANSAVELINFLCVHAGCRLVEQQQGGLRRECAGELQPPLLTECKIGRQFIALVRKIEKLQRPVDLRPRAARAAQPAREKMLTALFAGILCNPEILPNGQLSEQAYILERSRDPRGHAHMRRQMGDIVTIEDDAACGRWKQTAYEIDDRALARAVGTNEAEDFAARHGQIDAIDRANAAKMLGKSLQIKHCFDPCSKRTAA